MALSNMIPTIWAANLLASLKKNLVYGQPGMVNTDYEGEIKAQGNTVKINSIGPVTVFSVTRNTDIPAPEVLSDASRNLVIDQAKGFNFLVDDIDKAQTQPKVMAEAMTEASYALADVMDQYIAGLYVDSGTTIGSDAAPLTIDVDERRMNDAYELLIDMETQLFDNRVPLAARKQVAVPGWFYGLLKKDRRFTESSGLNGQVGEVGSFTVVRSNNVPNIAGQKWKIQASVPMARSFAMQITETEGYRPEKRFADAVKGLQVYGAKVVRPEGLVTAVVNKPTA